MTGHRYSFINHNDLIYDNLSLSLRGGGKHIGKSSKPGYLVLIFGFSLFVWYCFFVLFFFQRKTRGISLGDWPKVY